jgi:N-acetylneuraminic acid mutarotase
MVRFGSHPLVLALFLAACGDDATSPAAPSGGAPDASANPPVPPPSMPGGWSARASLPIPKQELAVVAVGERVYVLGGLDASGRSLADVSVYDARADAWTAVTPLPEPLHHINAAVVDGRIFVAGALRGGAFTAVGTTLVYDPGTNQWAPRASMPAGTERGSSFVASIGTKIYVAGGLRGGSVADFSEYDTVANQWAALPALPMGRDHGMGAAVQGLFYAIGGRSAGIGGHTTRVDLYDPVARAWSSRAPMPTSRGGGAVAVAKGRIVIMSGEGDGRRPSGVFPETEAYDPASDSWSALPVMPTPRHGTGAATVADVVIVPGGGTEQALGPSAVVEALSF